MSNPSRPACSRACRPRRWPLNAEPLAPPRATAFGALVNYICRADAKNFQPANITFDLLLPLDDETRRRIRDKKQRHALVCQRALAELGIWLGENQARCRPSVDSVSISRLAHSVREIC